MDRRGSVVARRAPGPFHCLACKRYVQGTESGHCPNCGFVPPSAPSVPPAMTASNAWIVIAVLVVCLAAIAFVTH
jgi:hypothetical protein